MPTDEWRTIDAEAMDGSEIIVGWWQAGVWIVRSAWWDDGSDWIDQGAESLEDARGWWSYRHSVTQEQLDGYETPTHWLPMPEKPEERY